MSGDTFSQAGEYVTRAIFRSFLSLFQYERSVYKIKFGVCETAYVILYKQCGIIYCCPFFALDCKIRMELTGYQVERGIFRISHVKSGERVYDWMNFNLQPRISHHENQIHISSFSLLGRHLCRL